MRFNRRKLFAILGLAPALPALAAKSDKPSPAAIAAAQAAGKTPDGQVIHAMWVQDGTLLIRCGASTYAARGTLYAVNGTAETQGLSRWPGGHSITTKANIP